MPTEESSIQGKFHHGQAVRVVRSDPDSDAPLGAHGTLGEYYGPNVAGTDWVVSVYPDVQPDGGDEHWLVDEACLEAAGYSVTATVAPEAGHSVSHEDVRGDEVVTRVLFSASQSRDLRISTIASALQQDIGGAPHTIDVTLYPGSEIDNTTAGVFIRWCGCLDLPAVVSNLCAGAADSWEILDDGWSVAFFRRADVEEFIPGATTVEIEFLPWSSPRRRSTRYSRAFAPKTR